MKLLVKNKYQGVVDEKEVNSTKEIEEIKARYKVWYPISFKEFDFIIED